MVFQCLALIYTILAASFITTLATKYEFILDNEEVFDKCSEKPDSNDIHDMVDLSDFIFEFHDGHITGKGNATMIWQGVQPSDRIEVKYLAHW